MVVQTGIYFEFVHFHYAAWWKLLVMIPNPAKIFFSVWLKVIEWEKLTCRRTESAARGTTSSSLRISDPAGRRSACWTVPCSRSRRRSSAWQHCGGVTRRRPVVPVRLSVPARAQSCGNTSERVELKINKLLVEIFLAGERGGTCAGKTWCKTAFCFIVTLRVWTRRRSN